MQVLIVGCGYVGTALGMRLHAVGHAVWGLRRDPSSLPSSIRPVRADLARPSSLSDLPSGIDSLCYLVSPDGRTESAYRAAYVDGFRNVLSALSRLVVSVRRLVYVSTTAVYGQEQGEWVDEESAAEPSTATGRVLLEGERLALTCGAPSVVARFGGIYGPGRARLLDRVRRGEEPIIDGPPRYANRIHRDDCAGVLEHLLTLDQPELVYVAADHDPADRNEVIRWLARELRAPAPPVEPEPRASESRRAQGNKRCRNARLVASGYAFRYPTFREGYGQLLRTKSS